MVNFNPSLSTLSETQSCVKKEIAEESIDLATIHSAYRELLFKTSFISLDENIVHFDPVIDRFKDIEIFKKTLIHLSEMDEKYCFNANQVKISSHLSLIVTQYPFREIGQYYFWQTCLQKSPYIIDLTNELECSQVRNQMSAYYPLSVGEEKQIRHLSIVCTAKKQLGNLANCSVSTYKILSEDVLLKEVKRIHFQAWPDHEDIDLHSLLELLNFLQTLELKDEESPMIHCRAGVGRTGTLSTILSIIQNREILMNKDNLLTELNRLILEGRQQRSPHFVQKLTQYIMLVRFCEKIIDDPNCLAG